MEDRCQRHETSNFGLFFSFPAHRDVAFIQEALNNMYIRQSGIAGRTSHIDICEGVVVHQTFRTKYCLTETPYYGTQEVQAAIYNFGQTLS